MSCSSDRLTLSWDFASLLSPDRIILGLSASTKFKPELQKAFPFTVKGKILEQY